MDTLMPFKAGNCGQALNFGYIFHFPAFRNDIHVTHFSFSSLHSEIAAYSRQNREKPEVPDAQGMFNFDLTNHLTCIL